MVLAAVLYVMVSGLIEPTSGNGQAMGVNVGRTTDGLYWTLSISSVANGRQLTATSLAIKAPDGSIALAAAPLSTYVAAETAGVRHVKAIAGATTISAGDGLGIRSALYPQGYRFEMMDATNLLASGDLRL